MFFITNLMKYVRHVAYPYAHKQPKLRADEYVWSICCKLSLTETSVITVIVR